MQYDTVTYWQDLPDESITLYHRLSWWRRVLGLPPKVEHYTRCINTKDRYADGWVTMGWRDDKGRGADVSAQREIRAALRHSRRTKNV